MGLHRPLKRLMFQFLAIILALRCELVFAAYSTTVAAAPRAGMDLSGVGRAPDLALFAYLCLLWTNRVQSEEDDTSPRRRPRKRATPELLIVVAILGLLWLIWQTGGRNG